RVAERSIVPLSEHEQRLLEQIEQALYAEDPKFASTVRSTDLRTVAKRRMRLAAALFVVGVIVLLAGAIYPTTAAGIPVLGIVGFCIMLFSAVYGWSQYKRKTGRGDLRAVQRDGSTAQRPRKQQQHASIVSRLEARFRRRFDDR
ncbi:MAG TPA: DUF3040 domain-containing protein, partial [Mycobacteriales bacterium]|nr:DUF3040 domain-containing protein [Mycobacteriales bacterium]